MASLTNWMHKREYFAWCIPKKLKKQTKKTADSAVFFVCGLFSLWFKKSIVCACNPIEMPIKMWYNEVSHEQQADRMRISKNRKLFIFSDFWSTKSFLITKIHLWSTKMLILSWSPSKSKEASLTSRITYVLAWEGITASGLKTQRLPGFHWAS